MRPKRRGLNKKEKLKVALKAVYFSVYEVYINATGCLNIIWNNFNNPEQFQPLIWMSSTSKICDMEVCETVQAHRKSDT
jgi:hypothetical protein